MSGFLYHSELTVHKPQIHYGQNFLLGRRKLLTLLHQPLYVLLMVTAHWTLSSRRCATSACPLPEFAFLEPVRDQSGTRGVNLHPKNQNHYKEERN